MTKEITHRTLLGALAGLIAVCLLLVALPIWFYLLYRVLQAVNATDLMWFLYWAYVPASFLGTALGQVMKSLVRES